MYLQYVTRLLVLCFRKFFIIFFRFTFALSNRNKMPKSTKRFIISNNSLNAQGFRMLTDGVDLSDFEKNPLLLFNHIRPDGTDKNQILPIGHWEDIEINGEELSGVPVFDDKDDFAMSIYHKVEGNHIRMCSAGAEPIETSANPKLLLPSQKKETVVKWKLKEASIVDIGANPEALTVALYDANDNLINLSDKTSETLIPYIKMSKSTTTAKVAADKAALAKKEADTANAKAIKLAAEAKKAELAAEDPEAELADNGSDGDEAPVADDKDAIIAKLTQDLADAKEQLKLAQEQMQLADTVQKEAKATQLADKAIGLRKITLAQKSHIVKMALSDYNGTVEYLNTILPTKTVKEQIELSAGNKAPEVAKLETLSAKSWDELFKESGAVDFIKLNAPEVYKAKYKEKFGKEPKNI